LEERLDAAEERERRCEAEVRQLKERLAALEAA
jgi:hypothetical protein